MKYNHTPIRDFLNEGEAGLKKHKRDATGRLLLALAKGQTIEKACKFAKVNKDTYYQWCQGNIPRDSFKTDQEWKQAKSDVSDALASVKEYGMGYLEETALKTIERKWHKDWRAAAWYLEHRYPEQYGKKRAPETPNLNSDSIAELNIFLTTYPRLTKS
jgi:hypothetical protein